MSRVPVLFDFSNTFHKGMENSFKSTEVMGPLKNIHIFNSFVFNIVSNRACF